MQTERGNEQIAAHKNRADIIAHRAEDIRLASGEFPFAVQVGGCLCAKRETEQETGCDRIGRMRMSKQQSV